MSKYFIKTRDMIKAAEIDFKEFHKGFVFLERVNAGTNNPCELQLILRIRRTEDEKIYKAFFTSYCIPKGYSELFNKYLEDGDIYLGTFKKAITEKDALNRILHFSEKATEIIEEE